MSVLSIRRDRTSYTAPAVRLAVCLAVIGAAKLGEVVVNNNFDGRYDTVARVVFCVVAAVGAILCYRALMEIGYVYDNRHPNAAASVGSGDMTVDEVMEAIGSEGYARAALLLGDDTLVVGTRARSAATEDFERVYFAGDEELEGADAMRKKLEELAGGGKLSVAAVGDVTGKKYARAKRKEK